MHRFYAGTDAGSETEVILSDEDARHAFTVLRMKPGQHAEIIREGQRWEAEIIVSAPCNVRLRLLFLLPSTEPSLSVTLYQGLPKADKMDFIVQKAAELGVRRIVPVMMSRCVSKPDAKDFERKLVRWNKIAREAGKQSGRCEIPLVDDPCALTALPEDAFIPETNIVPWEEASGFGPLAFHNTYPALSSLGILIGPEGGIDRKEIQFLQSAGFTPFTLGKRILRTETAGLAAVASIMCLYGEME